MMDAIVMSSENQEAAENRAQVAARLMDSRLGWQQLRREHVMDDLPGSDVTQMDLRQQLDEESL